MFSSEELEDEEEDARMGWLAFQPLLMSILRILYREERPS